MRFEHSKEKEINLTFINNSILIGKKDMCLLDVKLCIYVLRITKKFCIYQYILFTKKFILNKLKIKSFITNKLTIIK